MCIHLYLSRGFSQQSTDGGYETHYMGDLHPEHEPTYGAIMWHGQQQGSSLRDDGDTEMHDQTIYGPNQVSV